MLHHGAHVLGVVGPPRPKDSVSFALASLIDDDRIDALAKLMPFDLIYVHFDQIQRGRVKRQPLGHFLYFPNSRRATYIDPQSFTASP